MNRVENILLLGLGGVGGYVATRLANEGHNVTVIDRDAARLAEADAQLDARLVLGDARRFECWREVDAAKMDTLIAVTDDDGVNVLSSLIAQKFGITQKIVRVRDVALWSDDAVLTPADLHIDLLIRPGELAAQETARMLKTRAGKVVIDVGDSGMQVVAFHADRASALAGVRIDGLADRLKGLAFGVVAVARDLETLIPTGEFELDRDDRVFLLVKEQDRRELLRRLGVVDDHRQRVLIIGGGRVGERIAQLLQAAAHLTVLEADEARAEALVHSLPQAEVLHGDGSGAGVLIGAGLLDADAVVAAMGDQLTNIMTAVLAKHMVHQRGAEFRSEHLKTIALVERQEQTVLASAMGIDLPVDRRFLAANAILRYLRRDHVLAVAHLHGCNAEVVEIRADSGAAITRTRLSDMPNLKGKIHIGAVLRDDGWEIATGDTHICGGDLVVCATRPHDLLALQHLFLV